MLLSVYLIASQNPDEIIQGRAARSATVINGHVSAPMMQHHELKGGSLLALGWLLLVRVSNVSPGCPLLVDNGAAVVAVVASPWAVAVVRVSRGVTMVACSCRVVMAVVVVVSRCRYYFFPVVVVLFPLWRNTETHFECSCSTDRQMYGYVIGGSSETLVD
jgi:hypothetical protein